jgi:hypothetical protein
MNKLIIHKNLTPKTLFRVTGQNIYNKPGWHIARTKEDVVAYLTQFKPDIISIGSLKELSSLEVAKYIHSVYKAAKIKGYPSILIDKEDVNLKEIKKLFNMT